MHVSKKLERVASVADEGCEIQTCIDMLAHGLTRKIRHAHPDRGHDRYVVIHNARHPRVVLTAAVSDKLQHRSLIHRQLWEKLFIALDNILVAAGVYNEMVEGHVSVAQTFNIPFYNAVSESFRQAGQLSQCGVSGNVGADSRCLALNGSANAIEAYHIVQT